MNDSLKNITTILVIMFVALPYMWISKKINKVKGCVHVEPSEQ